MPLSTLAGTRKAGKVAKKTVTHVVLTKKRLGAATSRQKSTRAVASNRRASAKLVRLSKNSRSGKVARVAASSRRGGVAARMSKTRERIQLASHQRSDRLTPVSIGNRLGLQTTADPLDLNSNVALVVDQETNEVLFSKNDSAVLPIASLTKLMTGLVVTDTNLAPDELITITSEDVDTVKNSRSRLAVGTTLTRRELMHLALMSSENRAAHALGRTYPGGIDQFVRLMNAKAREIGMRDTHYVEPTGLSSQNQSSARDLAVLVSVAYQRPLLRSLTTSPSHQLDLGSRTLEYRNSNRLIRNPDWDIGLQKTGYISEAGRCLVMQTRIAGRQLIMVFLDASGKLGRARDAERVKRWVEAQTFHPGLARPQG
ncbi:MAG: serine hydrolase [Hydrogenophaga sp.]|nr:serine hydrolase [Hydrogenophaga sp.]